MPRESREIKVRVAYSGSPHNAELIQALSAVRFDEESIVAMLTRMALPESTIDHRGSATAEQAREIVTAAIRAAEARNNG